MRVELREDGFKGIKVDRWRAVGDVPDRVRFERDVYDWTWPTDTEYQYVPGLLRFSFHVGLDRPDDPIAFLDTYGKRAFRIYVGAGQVLSCEGYVVESTYGRVFVRGTGVPIWNAE